MSSLEDGQQVRSMNLSSMALSSCLLMQDCKTVLVGSWDNNLYIYSTEYGRAVDERPIHDDAVTCLCWKENTLVTASWDSTVKMWSFECKYEGKKPIPPDLMFDGD